MVIGFATLPWLSPEAICVSIPPSRGRSCYGRPRLGIRDKAHYSPLLCLAPSPNLRIAGAVVRPSVALGW